MPPEAGDHRARRRRPADEHPLHVREVPAVGLRVEHREDAHPDRRHAGRPGHPLLHEVLEQALRVEERPRVDELRAEHGREVRVAPGVRVEHRHDRQDRVGFADPEPHRVAGRDAERVQHRRAVRVEHAFRHAGRAARVTHRGSFVLVELGVAPAVRVDGCEQLLVRVLDDEHVLDLGVRQEEIEERHQAPVDDHRPVVRVRRDVTEVVRMQPQVERVQHEAPARDSEICLVVDVVVPGERRDAVAALQAQALQPDRECTRAPAGLRVVRPVEAPVRHPRDDLLVAVVELGATEQRRQRQLRVHHQAVHQSRSLRQPLALREIIGRDELSVAGDVAALAADDQKHEFVVGSVRDAARRCRLDVDEAALGDDVLGALDLERGRAAVDEVELVLRVVVVLGPVVVGREDDRVDAEGGDAERRANLAKAVALAERIERTDLVAHGRDPKPSRRRSVERSSHVSSGV